MTQIVVEGLTKHFQVAERSPGLIGAFKGLVKRRYRRVEALDGVSFSLDRGELVGYIGPNGAGKSTTVKILSGILVPTAGRCEVNGVTPWRNRQQHVRNIGVVFGQRTQLWWDLPVIESFELLKDIYRIPTPRFLETSAELIEIMDVGPLLDTPVRQLSLGQRMRCDLIASLLHQPNILFLDEPTIGLDAVAKLAVRQFVKRLNQQHGVTVILTTHDMDDIEVLCNRIVVIANGHILSDGSLNELRRKVSSERRLKIELEDDAEFEDESVRIISRSDNVVHVGFDPEVISSTALISRIVEKYHVKDLLVENPPIEELIAQLYEGVRVPADARPPGESLSQKPVGSR